MLTNHGDESAHVQQVVWDGRNRVGAQSLGICAERAASGDTGRDALLGRMLTMDLGDTAWTLQQVGGDEKLPTQVPGDHYSDLLRAGKIPDPYDRDNNKAVQWAAKRGWVYQRTFEASPQQLPPKA